jgi:hypothetical protein
MIGSEAARSALANLSHVASKKPTTALQAAAVIPMGVHFMSKQTNGRQPNQWWLVLLLAPFVGVLWVPFFNRVQPELCGVPFFFWYQFL